VAAFLALTWMLRGAPLGQAAEEEADEDAPQAGYRDRVVMAAAFGLILVAAGAYVATTASVLGAIPVFAIGFGIVIAVARVGRRHRHASPTLRRVAAFSDTTMTATLLGGILVIRSEERRGGKGGR